MSSQFPVPHSSMAHESSGEEAADPTGEARGSAREGAARQSEETTQPHTRARGVPEPRRERLVSSMNIRK